jgi:phage protein D
MAADTVCIITVGGNNVSTLFNQLLESLTVTDKAGTTTDSASITLDDSGGRIIMPTIGDPMTIQLGYADSGAAEVFDGTVDSVKSAGQAGGGRTLTITAKGFDPKGKAKQPLEFHKDDATLKDFMSEAAGKAGLTFKASGKIAEKKREYWAASTESFIALGQRIAREMGGELKIKAKQAIIYERNSGMSLSGDALTGVQAALGFNLIDWDITPSTARPRFEQTRARFYDNAKAKWDEKTVKVAAQGATSEAIHTHRQTRADKDEAEDSAGDNQKSSERERGGGTVTILGNPAAQPDGTCTVSGARPGVDGSYKIDSVEHSYSATGFTTKLELKHPEGAVGTDDRQ